MNDQTRNIHYGNGTHCDYPGRQTKINGKSHQWYRFQAPAGYKMPDTPPSLSGHKCGTHVTGYLVGGHPTISGQVVSRKVCFSYLGQKCYNHNNKYTVAVKVTHCGSFFVYQLPHVYGCAFRYCAE